MIQEFKKKLMDGEVVFGPFMKTSDAAFVEVIGHSGFDFAILDMEHAPFTYANLQNLVMAAELSGILPIVRAQNSSDIFISKALDMGAKGVQVPHITSAAEAEASISAATFCPFGQRGMDPFVRAASYSSVPKDQYFSQANETLVILQMEGKEAIDNLDEILEVDGFDILFIGPYDLSQSMGVPGQVGHPSVVGHMESIVSRAKKKGIVVGTFTDTLESVRMWKEAGIQYFSHAVDIAIFSDACKELLGQLHTTTKKK
ncbi:MAG: aldolase [Bacteroidetes bacterium]|nr:aldolase [Bacteroidota bacterium]